MASFWKTPNQIYKAILARAQRLEDGVPAQDAIAGYLEQIKFEDAAWELSERSRRILHDKGETEEVRAHYAGERAAYDGNVAAIMARIADTEAAVRRLMISQAVDGIWFAAGHRSPEKGQEIIPAHYWPFLTLDVENGTAKGEQGEYRALRCAFLRDVPADHPMRARVVEANQVSVGMATGRASRSEISTVVDRSPAVNPRQRGTKPLTLERVKEAMRAHDLSKLDAMKQDALGDMFGASRNTCVKALRQLLSELQQ
ncbi:hypothetical protein [Mesorhizobium argentiipisi]|uniref:Uncharacterized protein n=1 Tax=Mesorhizobium argentiipisi TaxID=3015175 RepID=A0ABU8K610_9HYPH